MCNINTDQNKRTSLTVLPLRQVQMSEVWPTRKDSEPRPREARAGSTPKRFVAHFLLGASTQILGLTSRPNKKTPTSGVFLFGLPERILNPALAWRGQEAPLKHIFLFVHLALPRIFSPSQIGQQKRHPRGVSFYWPTRKDSNLRPSESESDALSSCATGR